MSQNYEDNQDGPVHTLIDRTAIVGESIARSEGDFNYDAAELLLRNMAVIMDRVAPDVFEALSQETRDQVAVVAHVAHDVTKPDAADEKRRGHETEAEYQYRLAVKVPLFAFQRRVIGSAGYNNDHDSKLEVSKMRFGVSAAATAFNSVLYETQNDPSVNETINYFTSNLRGAQKSASRDK